MNSFMNNVKNAATGMQASLVTIMFWFLIIRRQEIID